MNLHIPDRLPVPINLDKWQTMDSTKLQSFCTCPRSYFYQYVLGWRAQQPMFNHLVFGQAWHKALEYLYSKHLDKEAIPKAFDLFLSVYREFYPPSTDPWQGGKTPENALLALKEYCQTYRDDLDAFEVVDTEVGGLIDIGDDRKIAVKLDLLAKTPKGTHIALEHKTGGAFNTLKWHDQWSLSIQVGAYIHALNACYDQAPFESEVIVNGSFFLKTKRSFYRRVCQRNEKDMLVWLTIVHRLIDDINGEFETLSKCSAKDTVMKAFPMRPTACVNYGGCQFHSFCTTYGNPLQCVRDVPVGGFETYWWDPLAENDLKMESETYHVRS